MTRILFVDDEPRILEGLRLGLRGKRKVWDMVFFDDGRAALADIERTPADVVVSDMRMPGMDGATLLGKVAALRPEAARIVLSGQMDEAVAIRAASVAHRFLSKPCEAKQLESVIARTLELHGWLRSGTLRSRIGGVESLPSLPQSYVALNRALGDSDVSLGTVAQIIERDAGMAAKILQLVNSSFFGLPRKMVNIGHATSYLGLSTMKSLALADSLFQELGGADVAAARREQERSLVRARVARRLMDDPAKAESASTAALLLHIGTLTLQSRLASEHAAHLSEARERATPVHEVERERLGATHAEVGAYLLGLWGLPHEIIEAVASHHAPWSEIRALDVRSAVRLADVLSARHFAPQEEQPVSEPPPELLEELGVRSAVEQLEAEVACTASESGRNER